MRPPIRFYARCATVVALLTFAFGLSTRHAPSTLACGPYVVATDNSHSTYLQVSLLFDNNCGGTGAAAQTHRTNTTNYPWAQSTIDYCVYFPTSSGCSSWTNTSTPLQQQDETTAYYSVTCNPPNTGAGTAQASGHRPPGHPEAVC